MGYETYISIIDKKSAEELHACKTVEDVYNLFSKNGWDCEVEEWKGKKEYYTSPAEIPSVMTYEFGKEDYPVLDELSKPLFDNEESMWYDYHPRIGNGDMITAAVKEYEKKIRKYFRGLLTNTREFYDGTTEKRVEGKTEEETEKLHYEYLKRTLQRKLWEWDEGLSCVHTVVLDKDKQEVTNSWMYEYAVFNLAVMYKLFDPEKHCVLYYGR